MLNMPLASSRDSSVSLPEESKIRIPNDTKRRSQDQRRFAQHQKHAFKVSFFFLGFWEPKLWHGLFGTSLNPSAVSSTCTADFQCCYFWMQGKVNAFTSRSLSTSRRRLHEIVGCIIICSTVGRSCRSQQHQNIIIQGHPGIASERVKDKFRLQFNHARLNLRFSAASSICILLIQNHLEGILPLVVSGWHLESPLDRSKTRWFGRTRVIRVITKNSKKARLTLLTWSKWLGLPTKPHLVGLKVQDFIL